MASELRFLSVETSGGTDDYYVQAVSPEYTGVDLTVRFADEISSYSNVWAWIKARITAGNFAGLHVGDYIPFTTTNGVTLHAEIAGINTYKNYGDTTVGNHIDFICRELWPTLKPMNPVNYNNGTTVSPSPWLASDLYLYLNSLSGSVPSSTTAGGGTLTSVDYTSGGVYYYLPTALKNVIVQKRLLLPSRYTAGSLLTADNSWAWANAGYLWIPSEVEVYGTPVWGNAGYGAGGFQQYPIFAHNMNRLKYRSGGRSHWWLLSASVGDSSHFAFVGYDGFCSYNAASYTGIAAPVCFRIS